MSIGKNTQKRSLSRRQFLIGSTLAGAGIAGGALAGCAPASPVSYTHLDVYKRQRKERT